MYNELPRKVYKTVNGLMNNEIFKKELELIMVVRELQVTYSDDESKQTERFNMATVLVKAEDGKHYKIQVQNDSSLFDGSFAMDFINHGDKIIYCAMYLYIGYINEATNFAESQGGGGSDTKNWGVIRMKMK